MRTGTPNNVASIAIYALSVMCVSCTEEPYENPNPDLPLAIVEKVDLAATACFDALESARSVKDEIGVVLTDNLPQVEKVLALADPATYAIAITLSSQFKVTLLRALEIDLDLMEQTVYSIAITSPEFTYRFGSEYYTLEGVFTYRAGFSYSREVIGNPPDIDTGRWIPSGTTDVCETAKSWLHRSTKDWPDELIVETTDGDRKYSVKFASNEACDPSGCRVFDPGKKRAKTLKARFFEEIPLPFDANFVPHEFVLTLSQFEYIP